MAEDLPNPILTEPELVEPVGETPTVSLEAPKGRKAAATFIFLTVALDMLALGMIAPVLPKLIENFLHGDAGRAAQMIGIFATVFAAIQFVFSPVLGALSDKIGRRPVVLMSNFGLGADYVVMALSPTLPWLFIGRIISGLTSSSIPTAMAYMADVTPQEKRAAAFGMLNAAFGIGFVLGPALGGTLGNVNPRLPFWIAAGLSLLNGMYGLFVLPESLKPENRTQRINWKRANPIGSLSLFTRVKGLLPLAVLLTLGYIAQTSLMQVYILYIYTRYGWTVRTGGLSLTAVGVVTGLYGAMLVKPAVAKLGERKAIMVGYIGGALGYWGFGFSKTGLLLWAAIPFLNLMGIAWPSAQSIMSRHTPANEQGLLQGAVNSLRGVAGLIGPLLFTWVFQNSLGAKPIFPSLGSPFYLAAVLILLGLFIASTALKSDAKTTAVTSAG